MKLAKDDGKEAYIKYNRLIVDGEVYRDGASVRQNSRLGVSGGWSKIFDLEL